jgi:DNA-binding phage protein
MATGTGGRNVGGRPRVRPKTALLTLVERLAARRGLTLEEVAERAGLNRTTLYTVDDPRLSTAAAIADALGVKVDRLRQTAEPSRGTVRSAARRA